MNMALHRKINAAVSGNYTRRTQTATKSYGHYTPSNRDFISSFYAVLRRWESETKFNSNPNEITAHPSYLALVQNAGLVLNLIKDELQRHPSFLVWVLEDHFDERPYVEGDQGDIDKMTDRWLSYLERSA